MRCVPIAFLLGACACHSTSPDLAFPAMGSTSAPSGKGSFRFGVSTASAQIEEQNTATDWYLWTRPPPEGLGHGTFVGDAVKGYSKAVDDIALLEQLHVDSYRMSIEWARIEPQRHHIDEDAIKHYRQLLEAIVAKGIRPMITVHHFSSPVWLDDPRDPTCANGPSDTNLCGWAKSPDVITAFHDYARLLGQRFGDLVDDWCTLNEPTPYLLAGYGVGIFPPGKQYLFQFHDQFLPVARGYLSAHVAGYDGLKEGDTADADHDGVAASVGFTTAVDDWIPAANNEVSKDPLDLNARDQALYVREYSFVDSLLQGGWDTKVVGTMDEPHPEWKGKLDWLGLQYYLRAGVTGQTKLIDGLNFVPCEMGYDLGSCIPPIDPTFHVPSMEYDYSPEGLYNVLKRFSERYPNLPFTITESGISTNNGTRRAQVVVRTLEQIARARAEGMDVRGMYHWSLMDNLEWARGFVPHFGLFSVNLTTYERTPTEGATVYGSIAGSRTVTAAQLKQYGGLGAMAPEP